MNGRDPAQKRKKETKATVLVPELGIPLAIPPSPGESA